MFLYKKAERTDWFLYALTLCNYSVVIVIIADKLEIMLFNDYINSFLIHLYYAYDRACRFESNAYDRDYV